MHTYLREYLGISEKDREINVSLDPEEIIIIRESMKKYAEETPMRSWQKDLIDSSLKKLSEAYHKPLMSQTEYEAAIEENKERWKNEESGYVRTRMVQAEHQRLEFQYKIVPDKLAGVDKERFYEDIDDMSCMIKELEIQIGEIEEIADNQVYCPKIYCIDEKDIIEALATAGGNSFEEALIEAAHSSYDSLSQKGYEVLDNFRKIKDRYFPTQKMDMAQQPKEEAATADVSQKEDAHDYDAAIEEALANAELAEPYIAMEM